MNKKSWLTTLIFLMSFIMSLDVLCQEPLWKVAYNYEQNGNYSEAILLKKQLAKEDYGTEWYIDDIAGIARCYSYTSEKDSTLYYGQYAIDLAKEFINKADSVAEEYIQNSAWCFYRSNLYPQAVIAAEMLLSLREKMQGKSSAKYLEWLRVMSYQAFNQKQIEDMVKYCDNEITIARDIYGIHSAEYEDAISSIRGYAHQLVDVMPEFTTQWIEPYYQTIKQNNILPHYQYEFEILQNEGYLEMNDLRNADRYANELNRWTYKCDEYTIPLEDEVRIWLKLAKHHVFMGDHIKARYRVENAWKRLAAEKQEPSLTQLVDRHNVERQLRMDTLGRSRINAEWIIKTATPIIEDGLEDSGTLAFFYDSRAWAYEGLNDYDKAIYDMQNAIRLNPLYSRKKKLAQFYLTVKDYELAEKLFLEIYNDPQTPEVGIRSIEADLTSLYWLWGKLEELGKYLYIDFYNMKSEVRHAFAYMNDKERETYLDQSLMGGVIKFDYYTAYSHGTEQWKEGNRYAYNLALIQKGLLLETTRDIDRLMQSVPDSLSTELQYYKLWKSVGIELEDRYTKEIRLKLMDYVSQQPSFLHQLNIEWTDVRDNLKDNEAAIEFINLYGITPENIENLEDMDPCIGALILRKDMDYPVFVRLASNAVIDSLMSAEDGSMIPDALYSVKVKETVYNLIWSPLSPYLDGVQSIFYAPTGYLQHINVDWLGQYDDDFLANYYNLYRVSSTRTLIKNNRDNDSANAIILGDIAYSTKNKQFEDTPQSKYRSITRSGFGPLSGTINEIDSISSTLTSHNFSNTVLSKALADEQSVRKLSRKSPKILHFATHGFYYTNEELEEEFKKSSYIGFQLNRPELYHSGLALAGAQDTWYNEKPGSEINFDKYISMDAASDGILLSSEISELDFSNTDLVVLSACQTALGYVKSEGVYGLQRAFKLAGVNSLIMSLWKVDDDATQLLMTSFYKNLMNGMPKREALINAQKEVRETPGFNDPYNWAAFILLDGQD